MCTFQALSVVRGERVVAHVAQVTHFLDLRQCAKRLAVQEDPHRSTAGVHLRCEAVGERFECAGYEIWYPACFPGTRLVFNAGKMN